MNKYTRLLKNLLSASLQAKKKALPLVRMLHILHLPKIVPNEEIALFLPHGLRGPQECPKFRLLLKIVNPD